MKTKTLTKFKSQVLTLVLTIVALAVGQSAWADGLSGTGTESDPWVINNVDDWNTFASNVNSGTTYSGQIVRLTADITITTGAGSSSTNSFQGTFEGFGHTLTLNLTHSNGGDAWIAPFKFINGATIKYLHTAGTITTNGKMAGGIVGDSWGTSTIQSCRSSVTISSSISGDATHGGLVGRVNDGTLTINDCLFDGSITGSNTNSCGGFVGWKEKSLVLNRCLQAGNLSGIGSDGGATFCRFNSGKVDFTTCYYRTAYGSGDGSKPDQGTQTSATGTTLQGLLGSAWEVSGNNVFPIMDTKNLATATISGVNTLYQYTGNEITVTCSVKDAANNTLTEDTHYTVAISPATVQEPGDYTLTITAKEGNAAGYIGSKTVNFTVTPWTAEIGGYCGDPNVNNGRNVYYEITGPTDNRTLTIRGTGAMEDYHSSTHSWYSYGIKSAVITEGVTHIGQWAFTLSGVTSVTIPASVTTIGKEAFANSSSLSTVTFAEGSQLETIGHGAFNECTGLTSITIPANVTTIGEGAFNSCAGLAAINVASGNTKYDSRDNCNAIIEKSSNNLLFGCKNTIIPANVTSINDNAFVGCTGLTSITIPANVTTIGPYAFFNCTGLQTAIIGKGVSSLDETFAECTNLTTVYILRTESVLTLSNMTFYECTSLNNIYVPSSKVDDYQQAPNWSSYANKISANPLQCGENMMYQYDNGTLSIIGTGDMTDYASSNNRPWNSNRSNITSVVIESGVQTIGQYAFKDFNNASFTSVNIPASVTTIGKEAFRDCSKLATVSIAAGSQLATIDQCAFQGCSSLTSINIPASVTSIWGYAFQGCGFTTFTVPSTVTTLGTAVFKTCTALQNVTLENSQLTLPDDTFSGCTSLTTVNGLENFTEIGSFAFMGCTSLTTITIPECIKTIESYAFYNSGLTSVHIPANVGNDNGEIGLCAFFNCTNLTSITVDAGNTHYKAVDGVLFTYDGTKLMAYPAGKTTTSYAVPAGVQTIDESAFTSCINLTSVTIPSSVETINESAFSNCNNLTSVTIPSSVETIEYDAFYGCSNLANVYVLRNSPTDPKIPALGDYAFEGCNNNLAIIVPADAYSDYKGNSNWNSYTLQYGYTVTCNDGITATSFAPIVAQGETVTLSGTGDVPAGYSDSFLGYSVNGTPIDGNSFTMPASDAIVSAMWKKLLTNTDITIANIPSQEYTGSALTPVVSISDETTELTKDTHYTVTLPTGGCTNAGDYTITLTGIGNYDGTTTKTFTITPVPVTLTANSRNSDTYDGTQKTVTGFTSSVNGLTFAETVTASGSGTNAGDYDVTFSGVTVNTTKDNTGNYVVTGTTNGTLTINPASVTLTANSGTEICDGTEKTVTGYTCSVDGLTFTGVTASGSGTNVGLYPVSFSGVTVNTTKDNTGNYVVTGITNGSLRIDVVIFASNATNSWMTWCDKNKYEVPSGCSVYTVGEVSGTTVTLTALQEIPANTPVLIYRGTTSGRVTAPFVAHGSDVSLASTDATGATFYGNPTGEKITTGGYFTTGQSYGLYNGEFVLIGKDNGIAAHRCVLTVSNTNGAPVLTISEGATGVASMSDVRGRISDAWFTLDGRKLDGKPTQKGLYINNGKKVVIK